MASTAADDLIEAMAEVHDELRAEFLVVNNVEPIVKLLKKNEETGTYTELMTLTAFHFWKYEELRGQIELRVARMDAPFVSAFTGMSDFAIDTTVYVVDRRDKEAPKGSQFFYQMFGLRDGNIYDGT